MYSRQSAARALHERVGSERGAVTGAIQRGTDTSAARLRQACKKLTRYKNFNAGRPLKSPAEMLILVRRLLFCVRARRETEQAAVGRRSQTSGHYRQRHATKRIGANGLAIIFANRPSKQLHGADTRSVRTHDFQIRQSNEPGERAVETSQKIVVLQFVTDKKGRKRGAVA
jgi:hypothetical protein